MAKNKRKDDEVWVKRITNRQYKYEWWEVEDDELNPLTAPAEYAVMRGNIQLARIVKSDGWRVVVPSAGSVFGQAISPVGLDGFRQVKEWSVDYFSKEKLDGNNSQS